MIHTRMDAEERIEDGSFADYLAARLIAQKNAADAVPVPELDPLRSACDRLLVRADGMTFIVWCIVDCQANPERRFLLDADTVRGISRACLGYSGRMGLARMPVGINIIEIRDRPPSEDDIRRLSKYRRGSLFSKALVTAFALDTTNGSCWTNGPIGQRLTSSRWYRQLLSQPRQAVSADDEGRRLTEPATGWPWMSFMLAALLVGAYVAEVRYSLSPDDTWMSIGTRTLAALGAINPTRILEQGEWYRLLTGPLLHGGLIHLSLNLFALMLAGFSAERLLGHAWFAAIFVIGALGGGLLSMSLGPPGMISVGASGGLMALLAAGFVCSFRMVDNPERLRIQLPLLFVLVPSLIPLATVHDMGGATDYAAHFGGAFMGVLIAVALRRTWRVYAKQPAGQRWAGVFLGVSVLVLGAAVQTAAGSYPAYAQMMQYIPNGELPAEWPKIRDRIDTLAREYPQDPRVHYYQARLLLEDQHFSQATAAFRHALETYEAHSSDFNPDFGTEIRLFLTLSLAVQNNLVDARREAEPVCARLTAGEGRSLLDKYRLCE